MIIYQKQLDKACFQHDMVYGDFKDLPRRTVADKVLHDKVLNIAKNLKYDGYQGGLALMVYKVLDKKSSGGAVTRHQSETLAMWATQDIHNKSAIKNKIILNHELVKELHKQVIRKLKNETYTHLLKAIFGELTLSICN